jgi:DNA-directed RNA polymerase specialized sigma subunit
MNIKTYTATVRKDGRWWLVDVPEFDLLGQARNLAEADDVAREVIGLMLDVDPATIDVVTTIEIPESARDMWERAQSTQAHARRQEQEAAQMARQAVAALRSEGLTLRETGTVLGLSTQRVHQLATAK